jgi:hypothetical protein
VFPSKLAQPSAVATSAATTQPEANLDGGVEERFAFVVFVFRKFDYEDGVFGG